MAGRESVYDQGFIYGVSSMMNTLIEKTQPSPIDKAIILGYAKYTIEEYMKKENNGIRY